MNDLEETQNKRKCYNCFFWRKIRETDYITEEGDRWDGPHGECTLISSACGNFCAIGSSKAWLHGNIYLPVKIQTLVSLAMKKSIVFDKDPKLDINVFLLTKSDFYCNQHCFNEDTITNVL